MIDTLVIAYGNPLRGDDGIAHVAAETVRAWGTLGVRVINVHQLVPELIDEMNAVDRVLFLDAGFDTGGSAFAVCEVKPKRSNRQFGHYEPAANLLALLVELEGREMEAWLMSIHGASFEHGASLTSKAHRHLDEALVWLRRFLREEPCMKSA